MEPFLRQLYNDTLHNDRSSTFIYLLHDVYGLQKLSAYTQEASLINMENEMDFLSNLVNRTPSELIIWCDYEAVIGWSLVDLWIFYRGG